MIGTGLFAYGTDFGEVLLGVFLIAGLIIFCTIPFWFCAFIIKKLSNRQVKPNQVLNRHIKADKLQYYRDHGLNEQERVRRTVDFETRPELNEYPMRALF